jgi:hypothetical protein
MRIEKDNLISIGLTAVITPFYLAWLSFKWITSQVIDLISMIFSSFKSRVANFFGLVLFIIIISSIL